MKILDISYSSHFSRAFRKMPIEVRKQAAEKERIFRKDCFDARLKTHKLKGRLDGFWTFSVNHSYRILFEFDSDNKVGFIDIGTHAIYGGG